MNTNSPAATGKLVGIAVREKSRAVMTEHESIDITKEAGLNGDFRGKPGNRQVTVLCDQAWQEVCQALKKQLPWITRRANLLVTGISLPQTAGAIIQFGDVQLQITGETDPCNRMDEYCPGLQDALTPDWRGGVCCKVISPGRVSVGDTVEISMA